VLVTTKDINVRSDTPMKARLHRVVAMLIWMVMKLDAVAESSAGYDAEIEYDNEHRCAELEHESQTEETQEPSNAPKRLFKHFFETYVMSHRR
jgi:hypothetical protein